jgi:hypothetical protein
MYLLPMGLNEYEMKLTLAQIEKYGPLCYMQKIYRPFHFSKYLVC